MPGADAGTAVYELYDYEADPGENKNLAHDQPQVVAKLREILAAQAEAKPPIRVTVAAKANSKKNAPGAKNKKQKRPAAA